MLNHLLILLLGFGCFAQTLILPLDESPQYGEINGTYYKDLENVLDNFTGTWQYTNGSTTFKIVLRKQEQYYNSLSNLYTDFIFGEYQYIENGIEKVNTLPQLQNNTLDVTEHTIFGNSINTASMFPVCTTCDPNQIRVLMAIEDPTRAMVEGLKGRMVLRRVDSGGIQKIEVWIKQQGHIITIGENPPLYTALSIPWGTYVLTKVN